jgi:hypothetical protein
MEEIKQDSKYKKPSNKKWQKYLLYFVIILVVVFLGIKFLGHKNVPQNNQGDNQQGSIQDLMGGGAGGPPGDAGDMPPPDEGMNGGPSQSEQNPGTPPQN